MEQRSLSPTGPAAPVNKRILANVIKFSLALGVMGYVVVSNWQPDSPHGLSAVWQRHVVRGEPIRVGYLALALVVGQIGILLTYVRWWVLVRAVGLPFRLRDAVRLGSLGYFLSTFLPGSVGGDVVKAAFLARQQSRRAAAVATVIIDRAIALWALICFVALSGAAFWLGGLFQGAGAGPCRIITIAAWVIVSVTGLCWVSLGLIGDPTAERFGQRLARLPRVGGAVAGFWQALWIYRRQSRSVYRVLALAWAGNITFVLVFYFSVLALWDPASGQVIPSLGEHFLVVPVGLVIQTVPLFPGGAGVGEFGFGKLYEWLGCSVACGVLGSLIQRVVGWVLAGIAYVIYVQLRPPVEPAPTPAELAPVEA
jgi:uncharacterized protein (TIRG00374 family)